MRILRLKASLVTLSMAMICNLQLSQVEASTTPPAAESTTGWKDQVGEIDKEIDKLTNQKNLYLAKATRLQNQGDRLQFESNNLLDARRAWQQAQINREIATRIQDEINLLEAQRQKILDRHGVKSYPKPASTASS